MGCIAVVPQDHIYVVELCGAYEKEAGPGFHCLGLPGICTVAAKANMRINSLKVAVTSKTKDDVFVNLIIDVQYKIKAGEVAKACYTLSEPMRQIRSYVYDAVRAQVPRMLLNDVFVKKDDIATAVKDSLESQMSEYGYEVIDTLVIDITPDAKVRAAMNDINASKRLKFAAVNKAEASKIEVVKNAEAEAESQYLQGEGIARQRRAIIEGMRNSIREMEEDTGVDSRSVMDLLLVTQYFDTLKEVTKNGNTRTVFTYDDENEYSQLQEEVRTSLLQGNIKVTR